MTKSPVKLYSDVSFYSETGICGWAYLFVEDGEIITGPITGTTTGHGGRYNPSLESHPIKLAMRRLSVRHVEILTDHPTSTPGSVMVDKRDPWHLVCHYAAKTTALQKMRRIKTFPPQAP